MSVFKLELKGFLNNLLSILPFDWIVWTKCMWNLLHVIRETNLLVHVYKLDYNEERKSSQIQITAYWPLGTKYELMYFFISLFALLFIINHDKLC